MASVTGRLSSAPMHGIPPALYVEFQKARHSKTLWITILSFALLATIGGLFMFILQDPVRARSLGLVGAKAQIFGGSADWKSLFSLILLLMSVGGMIIFGIIFVWIFGREFNDKTVYDLLSLPTSRVTIVISKIVIAVLWSMAMVLLVYLLTLGMGAILQLPGWSAALVLNGLGQMAVTGILTALLSITFGMLASMTRSYLPAVGGIFLALILGQVVSQIGYGQYFPWTIPMLSNGAIEVLSGKATPPPGIISYLLLGAVSLVSFVGTAAWWKYADQS